MLSRGDPTEGTIARVTPLADGDTVYVGGVELTGSTSNPAYATTDTSGNVSSGGNESNYNIKWDGSTLTLNNATITGMLSSSTQYNTVGIYACRSSGDVSLKIELQGENTITSDGYGIYVSSNSNGSASLTISGEEDGNLTASGVGGSGIQVLSSSGDAALTIQNTDVTADGGTYGNGVTVQAGSANNQGHTATLTVNGGSLTASGDAGIEFNAGGDYNGITTTLSVSNNALVDTRDSSIVVSGNNSETGGLTPTGDGIVFNCDKGTVYGDVTLQEDLTIGEGESLTLDDGASLDANGHNVIVDGGTLNESIKNSLGNSVKYTPTITTSSLPNGTAGAAYSQTLTATGTEPITWSLAEGSSLPNGLTLSSDCMISGMPAAEGKSTFTVKAANDFGSDSREFTLSIDKPVVIPVTGVKLDKTSLTLQETGSDTLTVTVEPDNATNKDVNWSSDNKSVATVDANGNVTAVGVGTATITLTTEDGGFTADCEVTVTHGPLTHVPEKAPTCTAEGNTKYWTCEICKKHFSDAKGKTEIALEDTVIPATGHSYGEPVWSWSEDGKSCTATFTCANDASHVDALAATMTSKVKTSSTCTETGVTEYSASVSFNGSTYTDIKEVADIPASGHHYVEGKCSVCGAIETTATVPDADNSQEGMDNTAASNKALPETSDSTLPLAVVALILGIGAITGIVIALRNMRR